MLCPAPLGLNCPEWRCIHCQHHSAISRCSKEAAFRAHVVMCFAFMVVASQRKGVQTLLAVTAAMLLLCQTTVCTLITNNFDYC